METDSLKTKTRIDSKQKHFQNLKIITEIRRKVESIFFLVLVSEFKKKIINIIYAKINCLHFFRCNNI